MEHASLRADMTTKVFERNIHGIAQHMLQMDERRLADDFSAFLGRLARAELQKAHVTLGLESRKSDVDHLIPEFLDATANTG